MAAVEAFDDTLANAEEFLYASSDTLPKAKKSYTE